MTPGTRHSRLTGVLASSALLWCATASAQQRTQQEEGRFQFRATVEAVNLNVVVTDKKGRFIPGLEAGDFEVLEDGTLQHIEFFTAEVTPVTLLLLLDASTSIRPSVDGVKEAAANFVGKLWDGDRAIIADFNERIRFSTHFSGDVDRLVATIQSLYPSGWTALYDSILLSIDKVSQASGRKALLVFTDGDDSRSVGQGSVSSSQDAIEGAKFSEVTIYSVGFEGRRTSGSQGVNKGFLKKLAEETGGASFFPNSIGELNQDFDQIQNELHSQYRMAYVPTREQRDGAWRTIELRVKGRDDLVVRTRRGYYAVPINPSM
ncbi:MAG TPA: VWA domain-containing protein [Vicinamibacteria bacterium]|nr:VWA domain-containing protein [Vicinamibacteria bacterium]